MLGQDRGGDGSHPAGHGRNGLRGPDGALEVHISLEPALRADIAVTRCRRADPLGNLSYSGSSGHASHPVIATCAGLSIVECDHFCDLGEIGPDEVGVPGVFIDMILV